MPPHIKLCVLPSEQLQTPVVCDGLPVQPGSGLTKHPHVPPAHGLLVWQRRPVEHSIGMYPLTQLQVVPDPHVVLGGQLKLPQLLGLEPQLDGGVITHG